MDPTIIIALVFSSIILYLLYPFTTLALIISVVASFIVGQIVGPRVLNTTTGIVLIGLVSANTTNLFQKIFLNN